MLTANIILPFPLNDTYTYYVPQVMEEHICVGQRVIVSFGAKRFFTGIVYSLEEASNVTYLKHYEIGRASCRKECRSRWSPYH